MSQSNGPSPRAETGPMQFGGDWTGVFLRGDWAEPHAMYLGQLIQKIDSGKRPDYWDLFYARQIVEMLYSCDERGSLERLVQMKSFEDCIASPTPEQAPGPKKGDV